MASGLDLILRVVGQDAGASKVLGDVAKAAQSGSDKLTAASLSAAKVHAGIQGIAGAVGVAAIVKFGTDSVKSFTDLASSVNTVSRYTGMGAEASSRFAYALRMSGVDADVAAKSLGVFEKKLATAADSGKATAAMATKLGTNFLDATGKVLPMEALLPKIADHFKSLPAGADKTALALELFGKQGAAMLPILNQGAAGLQELAKQADAAGLTLSGSALTAMKDAKREQREFDAAVRGVSVSLGSALLPVMTSMTSALNDQVTPAIRGASAYFRDHKESVGIVATALGIVGLAWGASATASAVSAVTQLASATKAATGWAIQAAAATISGGETVAIWWMLTTESIKSSLIQWASQSKVVAGWLASSAAAQASAAEQVAASETTNVAASSMGKLGIAAGVAAVAIGLAVVAIMAADDAARRAAVGVTSLSAAIKSAAGHADIDKMFKIDPQWWEAGTKGVNNLQDALNKLRNPISMGAVPLWEPTALVQTEQQIKNLDQALADLARNGNASVARDQFEQLVPAFQAAGFSADEIVAKFPQMQAQFKAVADQLGVAPTAAEYVEWMGGRIPESVRLAAAAASAADVPISDLTDGISAASSNLGAILAPASEASKVMEDIADSAKKAKDGIDAETTAIWANLDSVLALSGSAIAFQNAFTGAKEAVQKYGLQLDITKKGGTEVVSAFNQMVAAGESHVKQMIASNAPAAEVNAYLATMHTNFINAAGSTASARAKAEELWATFQLNPGVVDTLITEHGQSETKQKVLDLTARIGEVPTDHMTAFLVAVNNGDVAAAEAILNSLARDRTAHISIMQTIYSAQAANNRSAIASLAGANGMILKSYAGGGVENHVAQIAPGGAWRVWAEPETGGEAYIPLSPSKRSRSIAIWRQVGQELGVMSRADGGVDVASGSGGYAADLASAVRAALSGAELRLTGAVDTIGDAVSARIVLAYEGAV